MNHQLEIISDFCRGSVCCCHFSKPADGEEKRRTCSVSFMVIYSLLSLTFRLHVLLYLIIPLLPVNTRTHTRTLLSAASPHTPRPHLSHPTCCLTNEWSRLIKHMTMYTDGRWRQGPVPALNTHTERNPRHMLQLFKQPCSQTLPDARGVWLNRRVFFFFEQQSRRKYLIY